MAVTFVAAGSLATSTTTALSITAPACLHNDILIAQIIAKTVTLRTITPPAGWSEVITTEVNDCTTAADDHNYALYWKRANVNGGSSDSGAAFSFPKNTGTELYAGVISVWRGAVTGPSPLDATAAIRTETVGAADNVTFPAFDPTLPSHVIFMAYYGNDLTTFATAMSSDTNPDCTTRYDLETSTGNDATLACTSGDSDGSAIASRTWASVSTTDAGNTGVVFALVPALAASRPPNQHMQRMRRAA